MELLSAIHAYRDMLACAYVYRTHGRMPDTWAIEVVPGFHSYSTHLHSSHQTFAHEQHSSIRLMTYRGP